VALTALTFLNVTDAVLRELRGLTELTTRLFSGCVLL